ncbi:MAG: MBL fold metallo-hydrolase [Promethearchaeota archaeon]
MNNFVQPLSDEFKSIFFIEGEQNARYPYSHSFLIENYLIDTGISNKRIEKLKRLFPINYVLLSHWHEDHISGNNLLKDAEFYCHKDDRPAIEDIEKMFPYYYVNNTPVEDEFRMLLEFIGVKNTSIDKTFEDNDIINIGEHLKLKIIYTPGHTAGHCSFYEIESKIAFFGDIDLTKFPYYANLDSNLIDLENSIEKLKNYDINIAITGHRALIEGSHYIKEELDKYKSVILKRDERILENFSEKTSIQPIDLKKKNLIYKKYNYENFEVISELVMIKKHFDKFVANGLIEPEENGFVLS